MNKIARDLYLSFDARKMRVVLFVISIAMFVLAAGAPECSGDVIR